MLSRTTKWILVGCSLLAHFNLATKTFEIPLTKKDVGMKLKYPTLEPDNVFKDSFGNV